MRNVFSDATDRRTALQSDLSGPIFVSVPVACMMNENRLLEKRRAPSATGL